MVGCWACQGEAVGGLLEVQGEGGREGVAEGSERAGPTHGRTSLLSSPSPPFPPRFMSALLILLPPLPYLSAQVAQGWGFVQSLMESKESKVLVFFHHKASKGIGGGRGRGGEGHPSFISRPSPALPLHFLSLCLSLSLSRSTSLSSSHYTCLPPPHSTSLCPSRASRFQQVVGDRLQALLEKEDWAAGGAGFVRIDGGVSDMRRKAEVDRFQRDPLVRVALLSITAAGVGLTLTEAQVRGRMCVSGEGEEGKEGKGGGSLLPPHFAHVPSPCPFFSLFHSPSPKACVFVELFWNPSMLLQAEDRAHRMGQAKTGERGLLCEGY